MSNIIYYFFSDDDFLRISNEIKKIEKTTSGEVRVAMKEKKSFAERNKSLRQLAEIEFKKLKMNETRDKTGILIFILFQERQFYILADEGINNKVPQETWDSIRDEIQVSFKNGEFLDGILTGLNNVGKILSEHFPIKADDTNELSNKISID
jgi:uncharacterized membrane protein